MLLGVGNCIVPNSTDVQIIRRKRESAREEKKTLVGNIHVLNKVPKFVPQGAREERTAVPHHCRTCFQRL